MRIVHAQPALDPVGPPAQDHVTLVQTHDPTVRDLIVGPIGRDPNGAEAIVVRSIVARQSR